MKKHDLVVVGAGPAGLAASITAAENNLDTVLIEKSSEIGYPIKTSAVSWKEVLEEWNLLDSIMHSWYSSFYIKSAHSGRETRIDFEDKRVGTLDYHKFLRKLALKAAKNGSEILLSERVEEPLMKNGSVKGVKTDKREIESEMVIDCSGANAVIGKQIGLVPNDEEIEIGIGKEYEFTNFEINDERTLEFYVGDEIVPIGYGWVFPLDQKGGGRARVGVSTVYNTPEKIDRKDIEYWHNKLLSKESPIHDNCKDAQPYEVHRGAYPLCGMLEKPYSDGLILAGDSAGQAGMLLGEGIRYAMEFGKRAGITATEALEVGDCSATRLKKYVKRCKDYSGESSEVARELLKVPTNEYWEALIDAINRVKGEDKSDLFLKYLKSEMNYEDAKKLFPSFEGKYL